MIDKRVRGFETKVVERLELLDNSYRTSPHRLALEDKAKRAISSYFGEHYTDVKYAPGRSRRYSPIPKTAAHSLVADDITHLMPHPQFFKIDGETLEDDKIKEAIIIELLHLNRIMKFPEFFRALDLQSILCGTSPYVLEWVEKYHTIHEPDDDGNIKTTKKLIYNNPKPQVLDFFSVFYDPAPEPGLDESEVARHVHSYMTIAQLKKYAKQHSTGFIKYEDIEKIKPREDDESGGEDKNKEYLSIIGVQGERAVGGQNVVTRYGDFEIKLGDEFVLFENYICTWVNGQTLIRFEPNTHPGGSIPVQQITCMPSGVVGRLEGHSALGDAESIISLYNAHSNQFTDLVSKAIKGTFTVKINSPAYIAGVTFDGGAVPVNNHEDINVFPVDGKLFNLVELLYYWEAQYLKATGAPQQHTQEEAPRTAFEHSRLAATQSARTTERIKHLSAQLTPLFYDALAFRAKFGEDEVSRPPLDAAAGQPKDDSWVTIPREIFEKKFTITLIGAGIVAQKAELLAGYSRFFDLYTNLPPEQQARINIEMIIQNYWKAAIGRDDGDLIKKLTPEEELLIVAQQQAQVATNAV